MLDELTSAPLGEPRPLSDEEVAAITQWECVVDDDEENDDKSGGRTLVREFTFPDFYQAFAFLTRVAMVAQAINHHPEIFNVYGTVILRLSTHSAQDVTSHDARLAACINELG